MVHQNAYKNSPLDLVLRKVDQIRSTQPILSSILILLSNASMPLSNAIFPSHLKTKFLCEVLLYYTALQVTLL